MVDPGKAAVIKNTPIPKANSELGSFLGLALYYRRSIKGIAKIAQPLQNQKSAKLKYRR